MAADLQSPLLVFEVSGQVAALPVDHVEGIIPIARLARPPGLPFALEGVLNLRGAAVPVLRLDRLFGLPLREPGLYSMVIVFKKETISEKHRVQAAILVDRVTEVLSPREALLPVREGHSFNGCTQAAVSVSGQLAAILSPQRLLVELETRRLAEFQAIAQQRLQRWEANLQ